MIAKLLWQTAKHAVLMQQKIHKYNENETDDEGDIYIAGSHPRNCKNQDITTKCMSQIGFHRFAQFYIDKLRRNIQCDDHESGE